MPEQYEDESVSGALRRITEEGGPTMTAARRRGEGFAQRRGLASSTLAGQAGEQAVIETATPLARQEAGQAAARNLETQRFGFSTRLTQQQIDANRELEAQRLESSKELQAGDIEGRSRIQTEGVAGQRELAGQRFGYDVRLQESDIEARKEALESQQGFQRGQLETEVASRERLQASADVQAASRLGMELDNRTANAIMETNARLQINTDNLNIQERANTASYLLETDRLYSQMLSAIAANPDIPSSERTRLQQNALTLRDNAQRMIEGIYGVQVDWPEAAATEDTTPPAETPPLVGDKDYIPPPNIDFRGGLGGINIKQAWGLQ